MGDIRFMTTGLNAGNRQISIPSAGQPTLLRTWGIPTAPGWFVAPGKWNRIKARLLPKLRPGWAWLLLLLSLLER